MSAEDKAFLAAAILDGRAEIIHYDGRAGYKVRVAAGQLTTTWYGRAEEIVRCLKVYEK